MAISRVIEVSFGRSSVALVRIDTAYFYNSGIIFKPTDIELPTSYQVHWADSPDKATTLETIGTAEGAPIPDDLWNRSRVIYGWIYLHPTEDSSVTGYEVRIYKNVRAGLPDGTEPTPAEQSTIDQLIGALNSAVEQAEDAQEAIEDMSVSATTLAEGSPATVTKSEQDGVVHLAFGIPKGQTGDDGYSPTANVSKTGKTATITITDKNGTTSAQVEDGTDGNDGISPSVSVTDISGGHRVVITDKDGAKSFDVEDGATGATPNLTIGTVETLDPTDDATATITGTPENPVLNLGIPQGDAGEVTLDEFYKAFPTDTASGSIASFTDGADDLPLKSLIVDINPIQDLHGQDSPYPAGGGKNKANVSDYSKSFTNVYYTDKAIGVTLEAGVTYTFSCDVNSTVTPFIFSVGVGSRGVYRQDILTKPNNDNGRVYITFTPTAEQLTDYTELHVRIPRFSTPQTGTVSVSKIQLEIGSTATAWTPYENICPISGWTGVNVEQSGVNVWDEEWETGSINERGVNTSGVSTIRSKNYVPVLPNTDYYFRTGTIGGFIYFYDANKSFISNIAKVNKDFTTPTECRYLRFRMYDPNYGTTYNYDISINYPSTDHDYHPYTGRSITINLGQTVYGGKLDVLSGELTVYPYYASYNGETLTGEWISDRDKYVSGTTPTIGAQVVNIGAQGVTVQLSANQINSLYGVNNLWADSGDTTAEYRADTKLFIERLTAPDSADMIADANITSGQYFMVGNSLYKATANIANGGQITVGTNCTRVSLAQALNEINA